MSAVLEAGLRRDSIIILLLLLFTGERGLGCLIEG